MNVRLARYDEYPAIADFLHREWRADHVFTKSRALFDWQHRNGDHYNFVLGMDGDRILGVFGFIPTGQWDPKLGTKHLWLAIWKVADEAAGQGLGRRLLDFIEVSYQPEFIATIGASEMTLPMYRSRGYVTGRMEHWYARVDMFKPGRGEDVTCSFLPRKSEEYIKNRYLNHPVYRYMVVSEGFTSAIVRVCEAPSFGRMLRVVDVVGWTGGLGRLPWSALARTYRIDLIDFYCAGIPHADIEAAGFVRRIENEVVIPNHFEPFEFHNVEIDYAVKCDKPWRLVKGDSDMDRPNVLL